MINSAMWHILTVRYGFVLRMELISFVPLSNEWFKATRVSFVSIIPISVCLVLTHLLSVAALIVIILTTTLRLIILTLPPNSTCFHRPKDVISEVVYTPSNRRTVLVRMGQSQPRIIINRRQDVLNNLMTPRLPTLWANFCLKTPGKRFYFSQ